MKNSLTQPSIGFIRKSLLLILIWCFILEAKGNLESINVDESTAVGAIIDRLPPINDDYEYILYQAGDPDGLALYSVNKKGEVFLKSQLNYEINKVNVHTINVIKRKKNMNYGGVAFTRQITVKDSNNHSPKFAKKIYHGSIQEGLPAGSIVKGLEDCYATDLDSSGITDYTITGGGGDNNGEFMLDVHKLKGIKLLVVKTTTVLDRDRIRKTPYLDIEVQANDGGVGKNQKFDRTVIRIRIEDINDNPPVFIYNNWRRSVQENSVVQSSVMKISASDNDEGQNAEVYYRFETLVDDFYIHPSTGIIGVANPLDARKQSAYDLTVIAQDKAVLQPKSAKAYVSLQIIDIPNHPNKHSNHNIRPRLLQKGFTVTIRADLPVRSFVFLAVLEKPMMYAGKSLTYTMIGAHSRYFNISPKTGVVTLKQALNRLVKTMITYKLYISVQDGDKTSDTSVLSVNIQPLNLNMHSPVFSKSTVSIEISETINVNTEIGYSVSAVDSDEGDDGKVSYQIVGGTGIGYFHVGKMTGILTTGFTFKNIGVYDLYIRAMDSGLYKRYSIMYVRVRILPGSDSPPIISSAMFKCGIPENAESGSFVGVVYARSQIPDRTVSYKIASTGQSQGIAIHPITGVITTTQTLDYEQAGNIFLEITVQVQGSTQKYKAAALIDVINENDNPPIFTRPSVTVHVAENSGEIDSLVCLFATDEDGIDDFPVTYKILKGNADNSFSINPQTGQLSAKNLDYEVSKNYQLVVEASDGENQAQATVNVIVSNTDDPPQFDRRVYRALLDEGSKENTIVKILPVTFSDASKSHVCTWDYETVTPDILHIFTLSTESESCVVKVRAKANIIWKKDSAEYKFSVRACNKNLRSQFSSTSLVVNIRDVNTNVPRFMQDSYALSITGVPQLGKSIITVTAIDVDDGDTHGRITYDIQDGEDSSLFSIQPSGNIFIKAGLQTNKEYVLVVNARKQGSNHLHSSANVRISVHTDNIELPKFAYVAPDIQVLESSSVSSVLFSVDAGMANTGYKIVGGNHDSVFDINKHGQVFLKKTLDYEAVKSYDIVIRATIPSMPPRYYEKTFSVSVLDVNDNLPEFVVEDPSVEMNLFVDRYSPKGTIVGRFKAYDRDSGENGLVSYTIPSSVPFAVGKDGTITTTREISDPVDNYFHFKIEAMDNSKSTSKKSMLKIKTIIKEGRKPPLFTQQVYRAGLSDDVPVGTQVTTITTTDVNPMSTATFKISNGDLSDHFCIDATKVLSLKRPLDFDRIEFKDQLRLSVEMSHNHQSTLASVLVSVEDANDNYPVFAGHDNAVVEVKEDTKVGHVVYTASATDRDYKDNGRVSYSISQIVGKGVTRNKFRIDERSGELSIKASLNYEEAEEYIIIIKAEDQGAKLRRYALQKLTVKVIDVNDKIPHFTESSYTGYIPTNANPGYHILKVYAVDFDSGRFGQVTYSISGSDYDGTFNIGATSGVITLLKPIALLDVKKFQLNLVARDIDKGGQVLVNLIAVTMEGPPSFALRKFTFNVTENNNPRKAIGRVKGISLDSLQYSIVRGNGKQLFTIDSRTGVIYSTAKLDAESSVKAILYIRASDLSERFVETMIEVNILNVNDNSPQFKASDGLIEMYISRGVLQGSKILNVQAFDSDVGDRLTFEINPSVARNYFKIDAHGTIEILKSIKSLALGKNQFEFEVTAKDVAGATGTTKVRLTLVQLVSGSIMVREISEMRSASDGWFITNIPHRYSSAKYRIVYPNSHPFKIDQSSGYIGLAQSVDYEATKEYVIIVEEVNSNNYREYINYKIRVELDDYNDNKPFFTMKNLFGRVNKNAQPGTTVFKLSASDHDGGNAGKIVFEIKTLEVPFDIDPITSEIKTTSLVTLTQDWYNITVQAYDRGVPPKMSDPIIIHIKTGDNPPEFSQQVYEFSVSEDAHAGKVVGVVLARSLSGISIQYSVESGDQDNLFIIKPDGSIILQGDLDYESGKNLYKLIVQATEMSTQPLLSKVRVIIEVTNVNDNPPVFKEQEYRSQSISENVPIGTTVLTVSATDCDCGQTCHCAGGDLTYVLQKYTDTFKIDDITGEIKTIKPLDYDKINEYRFQVKVFDTDIRPQTGVADAVVTLSNVNDNAPVFKPDHGTYSITEIIARGTILCTVQAQDIDGDTITYAIEEGDKVNFEVGAKTGVVQITAKSKPSFIQDKYILKISASDGINKGYYILTVFIEDVNDNAPIFQRCTSYRPTVAEQRPVGTVVIKVSAVDTDRGRNGEIEYEIREPQRVRAQVSALSDFRIDNTTGVIRTNRVFDREMKGRYILLVIALDGGHERSPAERNSASCQLEIVIQDINDHKPIFSVQKYDISIAETTPVDTVVLEVSAYDEDEGKNAQLIYSIKQEKLTPQFAIDRQTGSISVALSLVGKQSLYSFQVVATDKGFPPQSSTIEIDIHVMRSNPPKFEKTIYKKWITEDVTPGTLILTVNAFSQTIAGSKKEIFYSILSGNLPSTNKPPSFNVDSKTGEIRTGVKLDFETLREYVLTLMAVDERGMKSNAKVFIYVEDRNDNSPTFMLSKYSFGKIAEGKPPGKIVEIVNATDADSGLNAVVKYHLQPSKESDMFTIDENTGEIRTKVVFDREITPRVTFHVRAEDQAAPPELRLSSYVYVTIQVTDVNDNPPGFTHAYYNKTVEEITAVGSNILEIQAIDKDAGENSRLNYYIISGNEKGYFGTSSTHRASGGSIGYITVARELDREDEFKFTLKVAASDSKYNAFTIVYITVIDSNDNDPKFTKHLFNASIPEDIIDGTFVLNVLATDLDTDAVQQPLTYSLGPGADGYFTIVATTGEIRTGPGGSFGREKKSPTVYRFNRELKSVYTFLAFASDGTRTGSASIRIIITDVNDERPMFLDGPYIRWVMENQKAGQVVGYVTAKDKDVGMNRLISYSLEVDAGRFSIHKNTGLIRTKVVLDRESNDNKFVIVVAATDGGVPSLKGTVEVTILVTDANDMHPFFIQDMIVANINECTYIGDVVTKVEANDNDLGINAEVIFAITSGNTPRRFRIDPDTGIITVAHRLDYEKEKIYNLEISVRDKGLPQLISKKNASVVVNLDDCNDNVPFCEKANYMVEVYENATRGQEIHRITCFDHDAGNNGKFTFFIHKANENYQFQIRSSDSNPNVGVIILDWTLSREKQSEHYLQIGIRDRGIPQRTGSCMVVVKVLDVNDNPPQFDPPVICGSVMEEGDGEPQTAMKVHVVDADGPGNQCPCTFRIIDDKNNYFEVQTLPAGNEAVIRSKRGVIFDREQRDQQIHVLKVAVSDGGSPTLTSETTVYIGVEDKNDNAPRSGGRLDMIINTYEGKFRGGQITPVYILDDDRTIENIYTHSIISRQSNAFSVSRNGMLSVQQNIPQGKYNMEFESTDRSRGTVVNSYVHVDVRSIKRESILCSVAIRFAGMRKPLTCSELDYPNFQKIFTDVFKFDANHTVEVFSVKQFSSPTQRQIVDVWFYVNVRQFSLFSKPKSTCLPHENIVVLAYTHWEAIERSVKGKIISIGIDACAEESCPRNLCYCYNEIKPLNTYSVFSDENGVVPPPLSVSAFVSLDLKVTARCRATQISRVDMSVCNMLEGRTPCLNGGTCVPVKPRDYRCVCPSGFEGPQCQRVCRTVLRDGYFWLPKVSIFCEGSISFEFSTRKANGLLLYQGPITAFDAADIFDFFAIDLVKGQIRIHVTQGESKIFVKTMIRGKRLDDGIFHHVRIYKKDNYIRVTVDYCNEGRSYYDLYGNTTVIRTVNEACEISGTIPGTKRFLNGIYPFQIGMAEHSHKSLSFQSFEGHIRKIKDNGHLYDLQNPTKNYRSKPGCMEPEQCNPTKTSNTCSKPGHCFFEAGMRCQGCSCPFGWMGPTCSERIPTYNLQESSFFKFVFKKPLTWYDRYTATLKFQLKTKQDGIIFYEGSDERMYKKGYEDKPAEFVIIQVVDKTLRYSHNLGDGILQLAIPGIDMTSGKWYNISVQRTGAKVELEIFQNGIPIGYISGSQGRKHLLDTNGVVFIGAHPKQIGTEQVKRFARTDKSFKGCIKFSHVYCARLVEQTDVVTIQRENVRNNCTCELPKIVCNPKTHVPKCNDGEWICFPKPDLQTLGPNLTQIGAVVFIIILLLFFALIICGAFIKARVVKPTVKEPLYYDGEGKDNVMPYQDDGAGEDDFFNYDLEKLLRHVSTTTTIHSQISQENSGFTNSGYGGVAIQESEELQGGAVKGVSVLYDKDIQYEEDLKIDEMDESATFLPVEATRQDSTAELREAEIRYQRSHVETIDVEMFIETRLADADAECTSIIKDTLLHYGYEGEGSDVEDLSELDESDDEEDIEDFSYVRQLGRKFEQLHSILNPPPNNMSMSSEVFEESYDNHHQPQTQTKQTTKSTRLVTTSNNNSSNARKQPSQKYGYRKK